MALEMLILMIRKSPETTATFSERGTYRVRLGASDGCEFGYSSDLTIHVNEIPEVNANTITNQPVLIIAGNALSTTITGSVNDDGYPDGTLTHTWSGPDNITIADITALSTTITLPSLSTTMPGSRVLRLTGSDGWESAFDEVAIVNNTPPLANAGSDRVIGATVNPILNGSGTDINLPYQTLSYAWSRVSGTGTGAGTVSFSNASSPTPRLYITGPNIRGTYVLQLTVSDGLALIPIR